MSSKLKSRELPMFEIRGMDEFNACRNFLLTTAVLPLKVERKDRNNGDAIIFYVFNDADCVKINDADRIKALGSLGNLYRVFGDYKHIIIREMKDYQTS